MDELKPLFGISTVEQMPTIDPIATTGDYRFAQKNGRSDLVQGRRNGKKFAVKSDDDVVLSDVAQISLMGEEGMSVSGSLPTSASVRQRF
jgi:hypothetical protein